MKISIALHLSPLCDHYLLYVTKNDLIQDTQVKFVNSTIIFNDDKSRYQRKGKFLLSKEHITHSDRSDDPRCENAQPDAFES